MAEGGGDGGVADAHFTNAQKVGTSRNRFHAVSNGGRAFGFFQCWALCDVACWQFQSEFENLQPCIKCFAKLVHRGTASGKIRHHLLGHFLREGRNALRHHAVIAGKHSRQRALDQGRVPALPGGQPFGDSFQAAQGTGWLGQLAFARAGLFGSGQVWPWQAFKQVADVIEGKA